jgi:hypothetical protein
MLLALMESRHDAAMHEFIEPTGQSYHYIETHGFGV